MTALPTATDASPLAHMAHFDRLFAADADPWNYRSRWYEQRKRELALACLPASRYEHAYEPGCANGEVTVGLATRCGRVQASDGSIEAVKRARERLADIGHVDVAHAVLPEGWPSGPFDLIVLSEFCYYLEDAALEAVLDGCRRSSTPSCTWLACHWRRMVSDFHRNGDAVHAAIHRRALEAGFERRVHHLEPDFVLEVWCRGVAEGAA